MSVPSRVYGITPATATMRPTLTSSERLGRLRKGFPAVRITKTTSVCVASDSTNYPVWNNAASGDLVPADGRLLEAKDLHVRESALTGESLPVEKFATELPAGTHVMADAVNSVFLGTSVQTGIATMIVASTGRDTAYGAIGERNAARPPETEFGTIAFSGGFRYSPTISSIAETMGLDVLGSVGRRVQSRLRTSTRYQQRVADVASSGQASSGQAELSVLAAKNSLRQRPLPRCCATTGVPLIRRRPPD